MHNFPFLDPTTTTTAAPAAAAPVVITSKFSRAKSSLTTKAVLLKCVREYWIKRNLSYFQRYPIIVLKVLE